MHSPPFACAIGCSQFTPGRRKLGWDEDAYRAALAQFGVESAADLDGAARGRLHDRMRELGFERTAGAALAYASQADKVRVLWAAMRIWEIRKIVPSKGSRRLVTAETARGAKTLLRQKRR